jgi:hypothetical protein
MTGFEDLMAEVAENAHGANGDLTRKCRIKATSDSLVDHVYEALAEGDCGHGGWYGQQFGIQIPYEAYALIGRLIARAMVDQFDHDKKTWGEVMLSAASHRSGVRPRP